MNDPGLKIKQQIIEKIKSSTNILVAVSRDPSVDELSAALGLTAILNKLGKHATAIFSGAIPPAITFLEPDKIFENTADSLRDFIIALDKEKADHLRYKVEGDVVKIFITPYRTTITSDDLHFSQGDFNIELVLALGVDNQEHLDTAITAHGQIMSDVTIVTLSAGEQSSQLGSVDWRDQSASCLSEMIAIASEDLKTDKTLLDKQISTALLTGIVSATDRFSNPLTSSRVMSIAAQLMAAGADQQLIAAKLQESHEIDSLPSQSLDKKSAVPTVNEVLAELREEDEVASNSDNLVISHDTLPEPIQRVEPVQARTVIPAPEEPIALQSLPLPPKLEENLETKPNTVGAKSELAEEPLLGGILNATSDQAAEDARKELEDMQNKTILSHSYLGSGDLKDTAPINSSIIADETKNIDIFSEVPESSPDKSTAIDLPLPPPPPLPDFSTLSPASTLPEMSESTSTELPSTSTLPPNLNDPTQFKIPGQ